MFSRTFSKISQRGVRSLWTAASPQRRVGFGVAVGAATIAGVALHSYLNQEQKVAHASGSQLHPADYPWSHQPFYAAYDTASMRRGFEVYRQICSTCHSLDYVKYRMLVGVTHTAEQAKLLAATIEVEDGPNDTGAMFMRPGNLQDTMKRPYPNEETARFANNGAYPPDLSLLRKARQPNMHGEDYLFALLTGYCDPPAGITLRQGLYYNPYFEGGAIAMPPPLMDGQLDYEDGTPATVSQMAKDVVTFLSWAAEPEQDRRKKMGIEVMFSALVATALAGYNSRFRWIIFKTRRRSWAQHRWGMKTPEK